MRPHAVLFDAVGTLIHPRERIGESYARTALLHGAKIPASRLEEAFRRVLRGAPPMVFPGEPPHRVRELERQWWRRLVRDTFRAADQTETARLRDFEACFEALFSHFARPAAWRLVADARETLAALRRSGLRIGVASNFDHRLPALLEGLGVSTHLELVLLPSDLGAAKPDPVFFQEACRRLGEPEAATVYVGDEPGQDLVAARRAGLAAVDVGSLATLRELPARIAMLEQEDPHA